jgi:hypothetical protein
VPPQLAKSDTGTARFSVSRCANSDSSTVNSESLFILDQQNEKTYSWVVWKHKK